MVYYGLKYTGTFKDYYDRDVIIHILEKEYTGTSEEVIFHYPAGSIEYNGSDTDIYTPIITSSLKLDIISTTSFKFIDFYSSDSSQFKINVYNDNLAVLLWTGFIVPELFIESYQTPPYPVGTVWTDCLKYLNNKKLTTTGLISHLNLILQILEKTRLELLVFDCVNIYEQSHLNDISDSPLTQTFVDMAGYDGMNCYEILQDIITLYGSRIYQKNGGWWIVPIHQFAGEFTARMYSSQGILVNQTTYNPEKLISHTKKDMFCSSNHELLLLPGLKELNVELTQNKRTSFIKNSDFTEWAVDVDDYTAKYWLNSGNDIKIEPTRSTILTDISVFTQKEFRGLGEINYRYGRFRAGSTNVARVQLTREGLDTAKLLFRVNNNGATPIYNIVQHIDNKVFRSNQKLRFAVDYAVTNSDEICKFWIKVVIDSIGVTYYLKSDGSWSFSETFIEISGIQASFTSVNKSTFEITAIEIPNDGTMSVLCFASDKGYLNIFNFSGELLKSDYKVFESTVEIKNIINDFNNYIPDTIQLFTGDFYQHENTDKTIALHHAGNEALMFYGGLYLNSNKRDAEVSKLWQIKELIETPFVGDSLVNTIIKQRSILVRPQWALSGDILFRNFVPDAAIIDYSVNLKKYLITNGSYNLNSCQFSGTFIEVGMFSLAPWILRNGNWNDDGIWVDEDKWNDSDEVNEIEIIVEDLAFDRLIPLPDYISPGDTIETLPETYSVTSDFIKDDIVTVDSAPYVITSAQVYYKVSILKANSYITTFTATVSGVLKTFKIYVYL